jgi:hypothetical protein
MLYPIDRHTWLACNRHALLPLHHLTLSLHTSECFVGIKLLSTRSSGKNLTRLLPYQQLHLHTRPQRMLQINGLYVVARSDSELTSETMNPFRHFGRIPWTGDRPIPKSLPTQKGTTQKNANILPRGGFESKIPVFEWCNTITRLNNGQFLRIISTLTGCHVSNF